MSDVNDVMDAELEALYDSVVNGESFETSGYFYEGAYLVRIEEVKNFKSASSNKYWFLVVCTILETTSEMNKVGERIAWRVDRSQISAGGNILQFMAAASLWFHRENAMSHEVLKADKARGKKFLSYLINGGWVADGADFVLRADGKTVKTKEKKDFTKLMWSYPPQTLQPAARG